MLSTSTSLSLAAIAAFATQAAAHMSIWHPSMYGVGPGWSYEAGDPVAPLGPNWGNRDDWWFRGPGFRSLPPQSGAVMELPAGGSVEIEHACHYAWTSYGYATTEPGSPLDACPGPNAGPYHSGDPLSTEVDLSLLSGCALAIADVDNINDVTMDNLAIFSVQHDCIKQKITSYEVPAKMPACTGEKCICGWFWLANNGTANFYMTAFDCKVTGSPVDATPIAPPQDPVFCKNNPSSCTTGSKRPIYAYNTPSNVPWIGNNDRAGYHQSWSFGTNGAQNDIFMPAGYNVTAYKQAIGGGSLPSPTPEAPTGANGATDLAVSASAIASSSAFGQGPYCAVDGLTGGYLADGTGNENAEWSSNGQLAGSWIKLAWSSPVTFNQIQLFDRPNLDDQVMGGNVTFTDGSSVLFGALPNDGLSPLILNFASPITTLSLNLTITAVSSSTVNSGLSEIEIFSVPASGFVDAHLECSHIVVDRQQRSGERNLGTLDLDIRLFGQHFEDNASHVVFFGDQQDFDLGQLLSQELADELEARSQLVPVGQSDHQSPGYNFFFLVVCFGCVDEQPLIVRRVLDVFSPSDDRGADHNVEELHNDDETGEYNHTSTASSQLLGQPASGAIDGIVGGIVPGTRYIMHQEWTSAGQGVGAWLLLTWRTPVTFNEIVLHDRPNLLDQILGGNLTFADGTGVSFGPLANDGSATPIYLSKSVTTTSLKMYISKVSGTTTSIGLSELMVYQVPNPRFPAASVLTPTKAPIVLAGSPSTTRATTSVKASSTAPPASSSTSSKIVWYLAPQSTQVLAAVNLKAAQTRAPSKRHTRDFRLGA
ncbi:proteophosphoglycan ppg4 [Rhodotorula toruloides]|uniref:Proteophosphoglycan ppg4 n=1 Tax=Rhodotorula toruloides TaxID=5286 RepID=A0A511KF02_RHOTO|nr:proteophosphoglycan ppg4 [Rhodotorula toruloides]